MEKIKSLFMVALSLLLCVCVFSGCRGESAEDIKEKTKQNYADAAKGAMDQMKEYREEIDNGKSIFDNDYSSSTASKEVFTDEDAQKIQVGMTESEVDAILIGARKSASRSGTYPTGEYFRIQSWYDPNHGYPSVMCHLDENNIVTDVKVDLAADHR